MSSRHGKCQPVQEHVALGWGLSRPCWKEDEFNGIKKSVVCNKAHLHQTLNGGGEIGKILLQFAHSLEVDLSFFLDSVVIPLGSGEKKNYRVAEWNECWSCEMSNKKTSLAVFSFPCFCFSPSVTFSSPFIPRHRRTEMLPRVGSESPLERVQFNEKRKKKNSCQPLLLRCPSRPHCLCRGATRTDGKRNSHFPSALRRFLFEKPPLPFPPGTSRRLLFHGRAVKFATALHPRNLTKALLRVILSTPANSVTRANRIRPN